MHLCLSSTTAGASLPSKQTRFLLDRPTARCLPPRPRGRNNVGGVGVATNSPAVSNASRETPQTALVAAITDDDFPRVLNGPAPGYAADALRMLLLGTARVEGRALIDNRHREVVSDRAAPGNGASLDVATTNGPDIFRNHPTSTSAPSSESLESLGAHHEARAEVEAIRTLYWRNGGDQGKWGVMGVPRLRPAALPGAARLAKREGGAPAESVSSQDEQRVSRSGMLRAVLTWSDAQFMVRLV